jgi:hypothetical protein
MSYKRKNIWWGYFMKKLALVLIIVSLLSVGMISTSQAATWKQNTTGWWWQYDNGSYPISSWQWLDGNGDEIAECYYFDNNGYMYSNRITPDNFTVDSNGCWTVNGVVQTKVVGKGAGSGGSASGSGGGASESSKNTGVTGRYDITSDGTALNDAYYTPIDKSGVTAINDPEKFCELMNLGALESKENVNKFGTNWRVDVNKPVVESGQSNIYYYENSLNDSRDYPDGYYKIVKVSKSRPIVGDKGDIFEVRAYGFENGYLLVNTTRNGVNFNERGEAVINNAVVKHTNYCYYGDDKWSTTLYQQSEIYWDNYLTWNGYPIIYHTHYRQEDQRDKYSYGFGDCCEESIYDKY